MKSVAACSLSKKCLPCTIWKRSCHASNTSRLRKTGTSTCTMTIAIIMLCISVGIASAISMKPGEWTVASPERKELLASSFRPGTDRGAPTSTQNPGDSTNEFLFVKKRCQQWNIRRSFEALSRFLCQIFWNRSQIQYLTGVCFAFQYFTSIHQTEFGEFLRHCADARCPRRLNFGHLVVNSVNEIVLQDSLPYLRPSKHVCASLLWLCRL